MGGRVKLTVGSLFSGIGGFDLGFERAGWSVRWQVENDPFCNRVLRRHWPDVKRYGDITTVNPGQLERVELICGGFPCQDLSVAGKREGLAGSRSSLFWEFVRVADAVRPSWILVENVPGLFSSNVGRDFARVIEGLAGLGYGLGWRVLDSQAFGVPQRRRRVFIVGRLGAPCPPEVLFESESGARHPAEGRETWPQSSDTLGTSANRVSGTAGDIAPPLRRRHDSSSRDGRDTTFTLQGHHPRANADENHVVSHPLLAKGNSSFDESLETYVSGTVTGAEGHNGNSKYTLDGVSQHSIASPIVAQDGGSPAAGSCGRSGENLVGYRKATRAHGRDSGDEGWEASERTNPLTNDQRPTTLVGTPAHPDGVREATGVPGRVDPPDGPRYRALGNAVTVPVAEWIGRRIAEATKGEQV